MIRIDSIFFCMNMVMDFIYSVISPDQADPLAWVSAESKITNHAFANFLMTVLPLACSHDQLPATPRHGLEILRGRAWEVDAD
jgi:hypothetical protein